MDTSKCKNVQTSVSNFNREMQNVIVEISIKEAIPSRKAQRTLVDYKVLQDLGAPDSGLAKHGQFPESRSLRYVKDCTPESQSAKPSVLDLASDLRPRSPCNKPNT